jgi:tetratricopeptide (TPR) repeat protein
MGGSNPLVAVFQAAVDDDPDNVYARFSLADLLAAEDRHEEALAHLDRITVLIPGYEGGATWLKRGTSLVALGRLAEAVASFERVLKIPYTGRCSHAAAAAKKAAALDRLGRKQEARVMRTQADELGRREGLEWLNEGNIYASAGEYLEAISSYDKSIAFDWKGRPVAMLNRGLAKKALGKLEEAITDIEAALVHAASLAPEEMSRALIRADGQEPEQVLGVLGRLVATMSDAVTRYNRASVRARLGNLAGAAEDLRAALALAPELSKEARTEAGFKPLRTDPSYSDLWPPAPEASPPPR